MHIVLLEHIRNLGRIGDVVSVKRGFARNYLFPQDKAMRATKENIAQMEKRRERLEQEERLRLAEAQKKAESINNAVIVIVRRASESGQLYGSVNVRDIVIALAELNVAVTAQQILLSDRIKEIGVHRCSIAFHADVIASLDVNVARDKREAEQQYKQIHSSQKQVETEKAKTKTSVKHKTLTQDDKTQQA